jgi:hypothetical protein
VLSQIAPYNVAEGFLWIFSTFIVAVFCLIDDRLKGLGCLRARGPGPTLFDSEVLTIATTGLGPC